MKDYVRKTGIPMVRKKLTQYIKELKEGLFIIILRVLSMTHIFMELIILHQNMHVI